MWDGGNVGKVVADGRRFSCSALAVSFCGPKQILVVNIEDTKSDNFDRMELRQSIFEVSSSNERCRQLQDEFDPENVGVLLFKMRKSCTKGVIPDICEDTTTLVEGCEKLTSRA